MNAYLKRAKQFKMTRQNMFSLLAFVMVIGIIGFSIYCAVFLVTKFDTALELSGPGVPAQRFDIKGFETLDLIRK